MIKKQKITIIILFSLFNLNISKAIHIAFFAYFKIKEKKKINRGSLIIKKAKENIFYSFTKPLDKNTKIKDTLNTKIDYILNEHINGSKKNPFNLKELVGDLSRCPYISILESEITDFLKRLFFVTHELGHAYSMYADSIEFNFIYLAEKNKITLENSRLRGFVFHLNTPKNEIKCSLGGLVGSVAICYDKFTEKYIEDKFSKFFDFNQYDWYSDNKASHYYKRNYIEQEKGFYNLSQELFLLSIQGASSDLEGIFNLKQNEYYKKLNENYKKLNENYKKLSAQNPNENFKELEAKISAWKELEIPLSRTDNKELIDLLETKIIPHLKKNPIDEASNIENLEKYIKHKEENNKKMSLSSKEIKSKTDALKKHKLTYGEEKILTEKDYKEMLNFFKEDLVKIRGNPIIHKTLSFLSIYYACCKEEKKENGPIIISYYDFERDFEFLKAYLESISSDNK